MSKELKNSEYKIIQNANHDRVVIDKKYIELISINSLAFLKADN